MSEDSGPRWRRILRAVVAEDRFWLLLALVAIVWGAAAGGAGGRIEYAVGDIATADVVAPTDLRVPDPETTQARREEAASRVLDVYDFDPLAWKEPVASLNALFAWGREQVAAGRQGQPASWTQLSGSERERLHAGAERVAGLMLGEDLVSRLWDRGFAAEIELAAERLLRAQVQHSLLGTPDVLGLGRQRSITVRDIVDGQERLLEDLTTVVDLESARARLRRRVHAELALDDATAEALAAYLGQLMRPNLTYNSAETQARKRAAADAVAPVFYQVKRGRTIVREGDPVTPQVLREIDALRQQWEGAGARGRVLGFLIIAAATLLALWRYAEHYRRRRPPVRVRRLLPLLLLVLTATVWMTRLLLFVGGAVARAMPAAPYNASDVYMYAIPFAVGPLLVLLLVDAQVAWVYAGVQALLLGTMALDVRVVVLSSLASFAAVYGMSRFQERTQMLRTSAFVVAANLVAVLGLGLMAQPEPTWSATLYGAALGVFGGVQVALLGSALLPALEWLFNTLTDVKLLELSNMNLPLLKQLAVVAPGTYHHSVVVGTLAEKAAEAIGANPLFARVAAYYHDVGKMRQPEYFVENQKEGRNPHDKLSPHMSALVLIRHVKDGIAYAHEYRLPEPLVDVIPQHHGTRLMRYFYERARAQHDPEVGQLREEEFRYPGPKPQTKEAALIMLADGVEAVSRLLDEPSPHALRARIRKSIEEVLADGQLDECEITLSDLSKVEGAFVAVLSAMYHQRIEYPEPEAEPSAPAREAEAPS